MAKPPSFTGAGAVPILPLLLHVEGTAFAWPAASPA